MGKLNKYKAKVLLFGEYGVMEDSMGLSLPLDSFEGALRKTNKKLKSDFQVESNKSLYRFYKFLNANFSDLFHLNKLENDISNGLYFDSTIPQGYGIGSSGALVAAIYQSYFKEKINPKNLTPENLMVLKDTLSKMESFFHGTSSGLDPLSCYINEPLFIQASQIKKFSISKNTDSNSDKGLIFLLNSGAPGETKNMVQFFKKMKEDAEFRRKLKEEFLIYNEKCIKNFMKGDFHTLFQDMKTLSQWAFNHLKPMIPTILQKLWEDGINTNQYYLKLCGSGGGGFFLGFSKDSKVVEKLVKYYPIQVIHRF